jgi:hypothetical protein
LVNEDPVPAFREINVLVHAHHPIVLRSLDADVQPMGGAGTIVNEDDLVPRVPSEARRGEQVGLEDGSVENAHGE